MDWTQHVSGASKHLGFSGTTELSEEKEGLHEMWQSFLSDILPLNSEVDWDYIRVELWCDSGRIIISPASSQNKYRIAKSSCQVFFPALLAECETIYNAFDDETDEENETEEAEEKLSSLMREMESRWMNKAEAALRGQLKEGSELKFCFFSFDDDEPSREIVVQS